MRLHLSILACLSALAIGSARAGAAQAPDVLITADCEGHVHPCQSCPVHIGLGGIERRATLVSQQRARGPVLLADSGNFLFGPESLDSHGRIMIATYNLLKYDAVNLSYRDFRLGKQATLDVLHRATFTPISANLLDDSTGKPMFAPMVIKSLSDMRVAFIGLTEPPAGMEHLPKLQEELSGIRFRPAAEALEELLPEARAKADKIVLLYYGSGAGLRRLLEAHPDDFAAVGAGGIPEDELPQRRGIVITGPEQHGKEVAQISLPAQGPAAVVLRPVDDAFAHDPAMKALVDRFSRPSTTRRAHP